MNTDRFDTARSCVEAYINGTYHGDVEKLKECFCNEAVMNGYLGEDLLTGTPQPFFDDIASSPSMEKLECGYHAEITQLFETENVASAIIKETGFRGPVSMETHFHLIRDDKGWKIVSKLFTTL